MSVRFICPECHNAYTLDQMRGCLCPSCARKAVSDAERDKARTELADDLVRGVTFEDLKENAADEN